MLDRDGYRPNVGIILANQRNEVFWGKRIREHAWQFPQKEASNAGKRPEQAMYRELHEEVGLRDPHVEIVARTQSWLRYEVPDRWVRREWRGQYRGQKQIWYLLRLTGRDSDIDLRASGHPEFDAWRWNSYWVPLDAVIEFKRDVYKRALNELAGHLFPGGGVTEAGASGAGASDARAAAGGASSDGAAAVGASDTGAAVTPQTNPEP